MFEIAPHPDAPQFTDIESAKTYIQQLITEITSPSFDPNKEAISLLRQACLVNLWFFLRFVASHSGPFEKLNNELHLQMCNFRQKGIRPGSRIAAALSRGYYKSTVFTSGGNAWEMLRDPSVRICIFNAVVDKAMDFMHTAQRIFDSNELFRFLFPEFVPEQNQEKWNDRVAILPNRPRHYNEPNLRVGGVGGASEGGHFDLLSMDDLIGLKQLNADRQSSSEMYRVANWFQSSSTTLLTTPKQGRIVCVFTRYSVDDVYESIMQDMKSFVGYEEVLKQGNYKVDSDDGTWDVFYRCAEEHGRAILPEIMDMADLDNLDHWTRMTQYQNMPQSSSLAEFSSYGIKTASLDLKAMEGARDAFFIQKKVSSHDSNVIRDVFIPLDSLDLIGAIDPAGTEKYITARTSRTAITVWGEDAEQYKYLIDLRVGYVSIYEMFDWVFELNDRYENLIRKWIFESAAFQRVLGEVCKEEQRKRKKFLLFEPVSAIGDKVVRIRGTLGPELEAGRVYVVDNIGEEFLKEYKLFPQNRYKMDIMDSSVMAIRELIPPLDEQEEEDLEERDRDFIEATQNVAGW